MKLYVGITDFEWFTYLSAMPEIDEVNFWQPSGRKIFRTLNLGEPFLFKLHAPRDFIAGGGFFAHSTILPISLAWDAFGEKNGAPSLEEMKRRIEQYRRIESPFDEDYKIGCILLEQPFFFKEEDWIPVPKDWASSIVQGKTYDANTGEGRRLWEAVQIRLQGKVDFKEDFKISEPTAEYGSPTIILPRLGQGSFRVMVTDIYQRRCSVTQERALPALDAVHIKPFGKSGPHSVNNGILLRSDIHRLFDKGYVTISPDYHFEVSRKIKEDFENGKEYYQMHGKLLHLPQDKRLYPGYEFVRWHNENVFRG